MRAGSFRGGALRQKSNLSGLGSITHFANCPRPRFQHASRESQASIRTFHLFCMSVQICAEKIETVHSEFLRVARKSGMRALFLPATRWRRSCCHWLIALEFRIG